MEWGENLYLSDGHLLKSGDGSSYVSESRPGRACIGAAMEASVRVLSFSTGSGSEL